MKHGDIVSRFESELAAYCGSRFAISAANGTVTLQAALVALGVKPGQKVATTCLTMAATTIAILNVGAVPVYVDVDPDTWIMQNGGPDADWWLPVALYGLWGPIAGPKVVEDAAQTLRKHDGAAFTSLSFQRSKVLSTGEGGALLTNDEALAERARSYLSLGYRLSASQSRIDSNAIKSPTYERHHMYPCVNGRMSDATAAVGLKQLTEKWNYGAPMIDHIIADRQHAFLHYAKAVEGCNWLTPQHAPEGYQHDAWTFAVACDTPARANELRASVVKHGGEEPYGCWRLTFEEPVFSHPLDDYLDLPNARSLQPRLLQFQTNNLESAERNASALRLAIQEMSR